MNELQSLVSSELKDISETVIPQSLEDLLITKDRETWKQFHEDFIQARNKHLEKIRGTEQEETIYNDEIISNAEVFALGPVCAYQGKVREMGTFKFSSVEEIVDYLKGKNYILYMLFKAIQTHECNVSTFSCELLSEPKISFYFRGAILV